MPHKKVLVLAGQSARNEEWLRNMVSALQSNPEFQPVPWAYAHWQSGNEDISVDIESERFSQGRTDAQDISFVVAKSAGIAVLKTLLERNLISPRFICVMGVPVRWAESIGQDLPEWLALLPIPALVLQNEADPACTAAELRETVSSNAMVTLIDLNGVGHEYNDMSNIMGHIGDFVKTHPEV